MRAVSGSAIALARSKRGWTQQELAARSHVSRETIAYRERSVLVRGSLAAEFDKAFGGSEWRITGTKQHDETSSPEALQLLKQLAAQVEEIKRHLLIVERNMLYRRRKSMRH